MLNTKEKYLDHLLELIKDFKPVKPVPKVNELKISITTDYMKTSIMGSSKPEIITNYQKCGNKETKFCFW